MFSNGSPLNIWPRNMVGLFLINAYNVQLSLVSWVSNYSDNPRYSQHPYEKPYLSYLQALLNVNVFVHIPRLTAIQQNGWNTTLQYPLYITQNKHTTLQYPLYMNSINRAHNALLELNQPSTRHFSTLFTLTQSTKHALSHLGVLLVVHQSTLACSFSEMNCHLEGRFEYHSAKTCNFLHILSGVSRYLFLSITSANVSHFLWMYPSWYFHGLEGSQATYTSTQVT